jgi:hypothetical protein
MRETGTETDAAIEGDDRVSARPITGTAMSSATSAAVCAREAMGEVVGVETGKVFALREVLRAIEAQQRNDATKRMSAMMMIDTLATTSPVLAAGWSLLYLLCGGGIGGAALLFIGLKVIGK